MFSCVFRFSKASFLCPDIFIHGILKFRRHLDTETYGRLPWQFCNFTCEITNYRWNFTPKLRSNSSPMIFFQRSFGFGENRQNQFSWSATWEQPKFKAKWGGLKTSLARKKEESVVKFSPINQFIKGFSPRAVNSYLIDKVEGEHFRFSSFSTERSSSLGLKSRFNFSVSVKRRLRTADCRMRTRGKMQTECKMQTAD